MISKYLHHLNFIPVSKYIENPLELCNAEFRWDEDKFKELTNYESILVNCSLENWGSGNFINSLYDKLESLNLNFVVLTHIFEDHLIKPNLIHHPFWYHRVSKYNAPIGTLSAITDEKKYKLSCLHGNPRPHRVLNYFEMQKYSSPDILTGIFYDPKGVDCRSDEDYRLNIELTDKWLELNKTLPTRLQLADAEGIVDVGIDNQHPAFTNSYINLVPETTIIKRIHQTEKIWKTILAGQLFLVLANPGYLDRLRKQGVDIYDDIIDHTYYDDELDFEKRFKKLHNLIKDLLSKDLLSINTELHSRRQRNIDNFYSGTFDPHFNDFVTAIRTLINDNKFEIPSN